jgi:hypothetical protein
MVKYSLCWSTLSFNFRYQFEVMTVQRVWGKNVINFTCCKNANVAAVTVVEKASTATGRMFGYTLAIA